MILGLGLLLLASLGCRGEERAACDGTSVLRIAAQPGDYLQVVADQETRDVALTLSGPRGRQPLHVDSLNAASAPPWPAEEVHWVADAPGELRVELTLPAGYRGPCGLRLAARRRATAADRRRALAEAELARGHRLRRTHEPEQCRAGIPLYESAERRFAELGLPRRQAEALLALGLLHKDCLKKSEAALQVFTRAEPLFAGAPAFEALVRLHRGELRLAVSDLDGAIADNRRALALYRGDRAREAQVSNNLGHAFHLRGRYDEAATYFDQALSLWKPDDAPGTQARVLLNRGQLHRDLGEADQARERFNAALALFRQAKDREGQAMALHALGLLAQDAGRPAESLEPLRGALALRTSKTHGRAATLSALGVAYRQLDRLDDARRAYAEALSIFRSLDDTREQARTLGNLGWLEIDAGRDTAALDDLDRALGLFRALDAPADMARILEGKARVLRRRDDLEAASGLMEEALAAVERRRFTQTSHTTRAGFFSTQQKRYDFLIDLLMEMHRKAPAAGHAAVALEVVERSLARSLLDGLAANGADPQRADDPRYAALTEPRPWRAAEIQRELLDRDTLLLEYRLGEERSFLWAVTPASLTTYELPRRAEIEQLAGRVFGLLARSRSRKAEISAGPQLAKLSRLLLDPVAPLLPGKRLLVVGDGALQSVPFAALPEPGTGEPLVARHEIVSLPSVSVLGELRRQVAGQPAAPKTLWVLADPDFGGRPAQLPYTRQEAAAILKLVPASGRFAVQGREARRAAVLDGSLRDYRFLHFATHGSFAASDPGGGRLVLAQVDPRGRPEANGFLHLADIYKLELRADLVVLSACQSALGREVRGEGMMGMTRGFFYAGAERVLVSLWNVNDQVTAELMRHFYQGVLKEGLSPAAALREAQDAIRRQERWRAPYYWAGFTLQGEWR
ncbi:MAG TPA: CHAT domain-containing protein [Thermoanaerobaculia bacterium]|nr:CHAT domain-containing protein [Thermoanaerobaculia bacterium]